MDWTSKAKSLSLFFLILLALGIRLHYLDAESLFMDEIFQVSAYQYPLSEIHLAAARQVQPPLDYYFGFLAYQFSTSDFSVRVPAAVFGTLAVVLFTLLAARLSGWTVALVSGVIYALLPFNVYFSQEARPYAIAIFLFLAVLLGLVRFLERPSVLRGAVLFLISVLFLYTRALVPLLTVLMFSALLSLAWGFSKAGFLSAMKPQSRAFLGGASVLAVSLACYLPMALFLSASGKRYISTGAVNDQSLLSSLFSIVELSGGSIWRAFVVQTEPIALALGILVIVSYATAYITGRFRNDPLRLLAAISFIALSLFHALVYWSFTSLPLRPPYMIFLLPLAGLLAAAASRELFDLIGPKTSKPARATVVTAVVASLLMVSTGALIDHKSLTKKADWRSVASFLRANTTRRHVVLFDSLSRYGEWEPTNFGFRRYKSADVPHISMADLPNVSQKFTTIRGQAILVLFQWREYFLTRRSRYPFMIVQQEEIRNIDYTPLTRTNAISVFSFRGFTVLTPASPSGNLARDSLFLVNHILESVPENSSTIELLLAAGALERALGRPDWKRKLNQALALTPARHLKKVDRLVSRISATAERELNARP